MAAARDLSRRQFLARSAGLAGASIGLGVCGKNLSAGIGEKDPVRLALVGAGDRGTQLLGAALRIPGVKIAAIADVDPAHLRRAADLAREHRPSLASRAETLLEDGGAGRGIDAVMIASPVFLHREHAEAALAAGKHVYLEKPMGLSVEDCRAVLRAAEEAEKRGRVFQIGLQRRYNHRYRSSIEAIHKGEAGRVLFVRAQWHSTGSPARGKKPWYFRKEKSGDIVLEQACHQMDVFNWVFGAEPLRACGMGGSNLSLEASTGRDISDHYGLVLEYPRGGKVHYSHLSYAIPDRRFAGVYELVFGEKLGIDLQNGIAWDRAGKSVSIPSPAQGALPAAGQGNDTQVAVEAFTRSVRLGERAVADAGVGFRATLTSLLAQKALDTGRTVSFDEIAGERPA